MTETDPEAQERLATLKGERGEEAQFHAVESRTHELIDQAFRLSWIVAGRGAAVAGADAALPPLIYTRP